MEIKTAELQRAYNNWAAMKLSQDPHDFWVDPHDFWVFIKTPFNVDNSYNTRTDVWNLSPESMALVNILNSPYRKILLKVHQIRQESK